MSASGEVLLFGKVEYELPTKLLQAVSSRESREEESGGPGVAFDQGGCVEKVRRGMEDSFGWLKAAEQLSRREWLSKGAIFST
jgi:hypothetical protein